MAEVSTFRSTLIFFDRLGIYDVILPFLLVFSIVFAILEKTMVLGTEVIEGEKVTKKNQNAMVAFVIAFLTVASSRIVSIINQTASQIVILLLLSVFFLMLVGSFMKQGDGAFALGPTWSKVFIAIMFIAIVLIFMNAITTPAGITWLEVLFYWIADFNNSAVVSSIILLIVVIFFMWFIVHEPKKSSSSGGNQVHYNHIQIGILHNTSILFHKHL